MHQDPFNIFPHSSTPAHRILPELWFNQNKMLIFHDESNLLLCLLGPRLCGTRCPSRTPTWLLRWELVIQLIKQKHIYLQLVEMSFYTPTPQWCGCVRPRVCLAQSDIIVNCSDRLQPWLGVGRGVTELAWFKKKKVCVCVLTFASLLSCYCDYTNSVYLFIVLQFLPVYNPSEEEKKDPNLYADNVQKLMARWGAHFPSFYDTSA